MGAAQSKKRRKERKRKKRFQMGITPDFDVPRSASADIIRTLSVSANSCPLCHHIGDRRTFSGSLESSYRHVDHACLRGHYGQLSHMGDGYESCPSCSTSSHCLTTVPRLPDVERSTMSLNRNLVGRTSRLAQTQSSEFAELICILNNHKRAEQSTSDTSAIQTGHQTEEHECENRNVASAETLTVTEATTQSSSLPMESSGGDNSTQSQKKPISILEDEESRLARWERQKVMAQQLRNLRKHIQQQEAVSAPRQTSLPFPLLDKTLDGDSLSTTCVTSDQSSDPTNTKVTSSSSSLDTKEMPPQIPRRGSRSKFSKLSNYRYLDNHPVLSKLQNEQNNRLESMENRMRKIRISAMQEAERRKFAEIFPAKNDNSETEKRLQEAREMLEKMKAEKRKRNEQTGQSEVSHEAISDTNVSNNRDRDSRTDEDSGDIIPVHIMGMQDSKSSNKKMCTTVQRARTSKSRDQDVKPRDQESKSHWLNEAWPNINLGNPLTWFLLPFLMFPLVLRMLLSLIIKNSSSDNSSSSSSNSSGSCSRGASTSHNNIHGVNVRQKKA